MKFSKVDPNSPKTVLVTALVAVPLTLGALEALKWAKSKFVKA